MVKGHNKFNMSFSGKETKKENELDIVEDLGSNWGEVAKERVQISPGPAKPLDKNLFWTDEIPITCFVCAQVVNNKDKHKFKCILPGSCHNIFCSPSCAIIINRNHSAYHKFFSCATCGKLNPPGQCVCGVQYCNEICQMKDWPEHLKKHEKYAIHVTGFEPAKA